MTQATAPAHRKGSRRRILWLSIILTICLAAFEVVAITLLGKNNDDLAFTIAGFFLFASGLSWIAYAIQRVGWAPVVGIIAIIGAGLAIYLRSSWTFVAMWLAAVLCAIKIAVDRRWSKRKWLVLDLLLGPLGLLLSVVAAYRQYRAARPITKPFPDDHEDAPDTPETITRTEEEKPPIKEYRESLFKEWLDVRSFWKDRRLLLTDVKEIRTNPRRLSSKSLAFAIAGALIPAFLITEAYSAIISVASAPKPQVERGIEEQNAKKEKLTKIISDIDKLPPLALKEPDSTHSLSNEQLQAELDRVMSSLKKSKLTPKQRAAMEERAKILDAVRQGRQLDQQVTGERQEAEADRAKADAKIKGLGLLNCLQKLGETVDKWKPRMMSTAFILTSYLFAFLMRHMKSRPRYHFLAVDSYLYTLGLALFLPNVAGAFAFVAADLSIRYDFDPYLKVHNYLAGAILLWIAVVLVLNAKRVAVGIDDRAGSYPAYARRIYWRLLLSQLAVGLLIEGSVVFIGVPLYIKLVKCPA